MYLPTEPLITREDMDRAAQRFLRPLLPFFNPEESGICLGTEVGQHGGPRAMLETFSRSLLALMPLLVGGGSFADTARWQRGMVAGTDPSHPGYWGLPHSWDQRLVEQPAIALSLVLAPQYFWDPLTEEQRQRVVAWLYRHNEVETVDTNWRWFRVLVNACLRKLGQKWSPEILELDLNRIDEFYLGDGWYHDENRVGDYYIPMAMHLYSLLYSKVSVDFDPVRVQKYRERTTRFAQDFVHWFAADGSAIPFGRSLIYRMAQGAFWGALAFADVEALPWGEIKGLLLRHVRWWLAQPIFSETGLFSVGYRFPNPIMGEQYSSYGSPYWAFKAFLPLALPADHPFWLAEELPMRPRNCVSIQPKAGMTLCLDQESGHVFALHQGQAQQGWPRYCPQKYGKLAYSTTFGFGVGADSSAGRAGLDCTLALSDDGGATFRLREKCGDLAVESGAPASTWQPWPDVEVRTWLLPALPGHLRVHRIRSGRPLVSADASYSVDKHTPNHTILAETTGVAAAANDAMGSAVIDLSGSRRGEVKTHEPWFHIMFFASAFPVLFGEHAAGETWLLTYATGWAGSWTADTLASEGRGWTAEKTATGWRIRRSGEDLFNLIAS